MNFEWIDNDQALADFAAVIKKCNTISIDTEFERSRTYYPKLGLIQIAADQAIGLIDPLAIPDLQPLINALNSGPTAIFHATGEDLDVINHACGSTPNRVADTQVAAGFAGVGYPLGLQALLNDQLSINLPKEQTRSDWLQRPLSADQLQYAANDVAHLSPLHDKLEAMLRANNRWHWYTEECASLGQQTREEAAPEAMWVRFRNAWQLGYQQLAALQAMAAWRERLAREHNLPRTWIFPDAAMFAIAETLPKTPDKLASIRALPADIAKQHQASIFVCLEHAQTTDMRDKAQHDLISIKQRQRHGQKVKCLLRTHADQKAIPYEILIPKRVLNDLLDAGSATDLPESLQGWRSEALGEILPQAIAINSPQS